MKSKLCFWQDKAMNKDYILSHLQITVNAMETIATVLPGTIVNVMGQTIVCVMVQIIAVVISHRNVKCY